MQLRTTMNTTSPPAPRPTPATTDAQPCPRPPTRDQWRRILSEPQDAPPVFCASCGLVWPSDGELLRPMTLASTPDEIRPPAHSRHTRPEPPRPGSPLPRLTRGLWHTALAQAAAGNSWFTCDICRGVWPDSLAAGRTGRNWFCEACAHGANSPEAEGGLHA